MIRLEKGWIEMGLQSLEAAACRTISLCCKGNNFP
jgi:hypothetical protein